MFVCCFGGAAFKLAIWLSFIMPSASHACMHLQPGWHSGAATRLSCVLLNFFSFTMVSGDYCRCLCPLCMIDWSLLPNPYPFISSWRFVLLLSHFLVVFIVFSFSFKRMVSVKQNTATSVVALRLTFLILFKAKMPCTVNVSGRQWRSWPHIQGLLELLSVMIFKGIFLVECR